MATHKTVCFTGTDSAEGEKLKSLFVEVNRRVGDAWTIAPESEAQMLIIDVDTLYGHMAWLKVHNSGRIVVALSSSEKAEADHLLRRPVTSDALAALLGAHANVAVAPAPPAPAAAPAPPVPAPAPPPVATLPEPEPAPAPDPMLGDHLVPGALPGPVKLKLDDAPLLVVDPHARAYLGAAALKPYLPYAKAVIRSEDWTAVTPSEVERLKGELGGTQPLVRLQWLAALAAGAGTIARGHDPNQRYKLLKWPQIEREFPKHFRIATAMMKGPQLLTEIAEGSGATLVEVTDFVNASLVTGFAEMDLPPPAADAAGATGKGGLLGRLRGAR